MCVVIGEGAAHPSPAPVPKWTSLCPQSRPQLRLASLTCPPLRAPTPSCPARPEAVLSPTSPGKKMASLCLELWGSLPSCLPGSCWLRTQR